MGSSSCQCAFLNAINSNGSEMQTMSKKALVNETESQPQTATQLSSVLGTKLGGGDSLDWIKTNKRGWGSAVLFSA